MICRIIVTLLFTTCLTAADRSLSIISLGSFLIIEKDPPFNYTSAIKECKHFETALLNINHLSSLSRTPRALFLLENQTIIMESSNDLLRKNYVMVAYFASHKVLGSSMRFFYLPMNTSLCNMTVCYNDYKYSTYDDQGLYMIAYFMIIVIVISLVLVIYFTAILFTVNNVYKQVQNTPTQANKYEFI